MIRINLLPLRAERKKEDARRLVSTYILTVGLVLLVMGWWHVAGMRKVARLETQLATNKREVAHFTQVAEQIKVLEAQKAEIDGKLEVIRTLEKSKTGPVHLLDEVAARLPAQRLWLTSLEQAAATLTLKGEALDNESIAAYMRQLAESSYVANVDLLSAEQKERDGAKVMAFSLTCQVSMTGEARRAPAQAKPGQPSQAGTAGQRMAQR